MEIVLASQDEGVQILTGLGLTLSQARVYLALARSGVSTAKTISRVSNVPREHAYRVVSELQKLGLVERIIAKPNEYRATPIYDGISILMERRMKKTSELEAKTREFLKSHRENKTKTKIQEEKEQFVLIPKQEVLVKRRKKAIETAQTSVHVVTSWKRYSLVMFSLKEEFRKVAKRGVQICYITEKPKDEKSLVRAKEIEQALKKYPSFQVRYVCTPITTVVAVFDKKEMIVIASPSLGLDESPALWSNNPSLIELAENYFETMWTKSPECEYEKH